MKKYPKSKLTIRTIGRKKIITFYNALIGDRSKWTLNNKMVTSYMIYDSKNKKVYDQSFSTKSEIISAPKGPYLELAILAADHRFKALQEK